MRILDKHIRKALRERLYKQSKARPLIIEEIAVQRGLAVADVVALFKQPHCYEIKSDSDTLKRLKTQAPLFSSYFPKVTIVVTEKHISNIKKAIPDYWGIIEAKGTPDNVIFKPLRKASYNPHHNHKILLATLWNDELKKVIESHDLPYSKSYDRDMLASVLSKELTKGEIYTTFKNFQQEKKLKLA